MTKPFVISRLFDAPQHLMWDVYTNPAHLSQWFGPKGRTIIKSVMDLKVGGTYHYGMEFSGTRIWGLWRFTEVSAPDRLSVIQCFSDETGGVTRHPMAPVWPLHMLATTTLTPQDGKTLLTVQWSPHDADSAAIAAFDASHPSMQQGWGGSFEVLAEHLKTLDR
jgi:uncharacterized protein YndB with AHSA1/START domain